MCVMGMGRQTYTRFIGNIPKKQCLRGQNSPYSWIEHQVLDNRDKVETMNVSKVVNGHFNYLL